MLTKNRGGHYINCNSQVGSQSRWAIKNVLGQRIDYSCNCLELEEEERIRKSQVNSSPNPQGFHSTIANQNVNKGQPIFYTNVPRMSTVAAPLADVLSKAMYDRVNETDEIHKPYIKVLSYYDILSETLNALAYHASIWGINYDSDTTDIVDIFHRNYKYRIKEALVNNPQLLKMPKPEMKLVMIGMDVDLRYLSSTSFVVKPLKSSSYNSYVLRKGTFWVLNEPVQDTPPFYLFEFPSNQGLQPKTDHVLLIDPYIPEEDFLTDCVYHKFGIKIMRKFDIKDARKLLDTRKTVFNSTPSATNTILLFQLMDAIVLNDFKTGTLDLDKTGEKNLVRLEKLKNLALDTKFNEERKNAVDKAFMQFDIICSKKEEKVG